MLEVKGQITECLGPEADARVGSEGPPEEQSYFRSPNVVTWAHLTEPPTREQARKSSVIPPVSDGRERCTNPVLGLTRLEDLRLLLLIGGE